MSLLAGRRRFILIAIFAVSLLYPAALYWYEIERTIRSAARPLWANPEGPRNLLPHVYADNLWITSEVCELHGWDAHPAAHVREVWDSVILDGPTDAELDILEIRLHELRDVVDKIFVVESNRTINGTPKDYYFGSARYEDRFGAFHSKLVYRAVPSPPTDSLLSPSPDDWRMHIRSEMNKLMRTRASNTRAPPLVLFAAPDEVPAAHTMRLLRACTFPSPLHLQLHRYAYSFEWPAGWDSWHAQVHAWDTGATLRDLGNNEARVERRRTEYSQELVSENILADAGWHCTYCFKDIDDIVAKMQDELGAGAASLTPERVQQAICDGKDIFNMLPEAYSYKDMLQMLNPEPSKSAVGVPWYVVEAHHKYRYLLPGGCDRSRTPQVQIQMAPKKEALAPPS